MPMTTPPTSARPTTPIRDDGRPSPTTMLQEELEATERRFFGHDGDQLTMSLKQLVIEHITRSQTDD